jgi:TRAP-type mannitol/chloroaromatic compound transport system substrate-binding protein
MRNIVLLVVGLAAGLAFGFFNWKSDGMAPAPNAETAAPAEEARAAKVSWKMASSFPSTMVLIGSMGLHLSESVETLSDGDFTLKFYEPGALVPALEIFDAVSTGAIDAGWTASGYWAGKVPALQFFTAVPFGPATGEYMAWLYYGGGIEIYDELYARHNIKGIPCASVAPEASGWFREEITSPEDLKGLKMRFFGLGAKVMEKLGVSTQLIAGGDIYPALELGTIDATEFSMPAIDKELGFHQIAGHYYFPGWHQQSTFIELMVNMDRWNELDERRKAQVEIACGENFRQSIAEGEAIQFGALEELAAAGVEAHRWPDDMMAAFSGAWDEVVVEEAAADPDFAKVWESLSSFREKYAVWKNLGYL